MRSRSQSHYVDSRLVGVHLGGGAVNRAALLLNRPHFFIETPIKNGADDHEEGDEIEASQCESEGREFREPTQLPIPSITVVGMGKEPTMSTNGWTNVLLRTKAMLQRRLGAVIQEGITESERFAISSHLWRCANPNSPKCDVLMTLRGPAIGGEESEAEHEKNKRQALWLIDALKRILAPELHIEVRYHQLTHSYALYLATSYVQLLKDAELCHLKKRLKACFGGTLKEFTLDEAQCFKGIGDRHHFLSSMERAMLLKQRLDMIRTPNGGMDMVDGGRIVGGVTVVENLKEAGIIESLLPLHETEKLKHLQHTWVYAPLDEQPLEEIKDYFGHEIALYFAWLGHLTSALWVPAVLGLLISLSCGYLPPFVVRFDHGATHPPSTLISDICFVAFALFNCLWSTAYLESWKRRQAELAFKWGTYDGTTDSAVSVESSLALAQSPRPSFRGDSTSPNPVTGCLEPTTSEWKQALVRYGLSYPITALVIFALFASLFALLQLQDLADSQFKSSALTLWIAYLPMVLQALLILVAENFYRHLALVLNDAENYRSDEDYENNLITKIAAFQCVSAFGSLFYIAFYLRDMHRLQEMLATLLITRQLTQNFMELAVPFAAEKLRLCRLTYRLTKSISNESLRKRVEAVKRRRDTEAAAVTEPGEANPADGGHHQWDSGIFNWFRSSIRLSRSENRWGDTRLRRTNVLDANMQLLGKLSRSGSRLDSVAKGLPSHRLPVPEFCPGPAAEGRGEEEQGLTVDLYLFCVPPHRIVTDLELTEAELQTLMSEYVRPLDDYLEMFIQFGYVLLFSPAFPPAALCALINNLFEIRIDAFKLCNAVQRPFGRRVKSIGAWQTAMELMGVVGVMVNCALIGQSGLVQRLWPDISFAAQLLIVVVLEHAILAAKVWLDRIIPDVPVIPAEVQSLRPQRRINSFKHHIQVEIAKVEHWRREAYRRETKLSANDYPLVDPVTHETGQETPRNPCTNGEKHQSTAFNSLDERASHDCESVVVATSDEEEAPVVHGLRRLTNPFSMFMSQRRRRNRSATTTNLKGVPD